MRYVFALVVVTATALSQGAVPLHACGDKLLMLGRGIRFQSKHAPRAAAVLLYVPETGAGRTLSDPKLESTLREAGHAVRAVTTKPDLESALQGGTFDVVLANITDAPDLERALGVAAGSAVVLPAVYLVAPESQQQRARDLARADRAKAEKEFVVVVDVPGRPGHYCAAVDKAMQLKLEREKTAARRP
jgi:hypothetical protein